MTKENKTYSEVYHAINDLKNPYDIYSDNRAYFGYETAKADVKSLIVELQVKKVIGD